MITVCVTNLSGTLNCLTFQHNRSPACQSAHPFSIFSNSANRDRYTFSPSSLTHTQLLHGSLTIFVQRFFYACCSAMLIQFFLDLVSVTIEIKMNDMKRKRFTRLCIPRPHGLLWGRSIFSPVALRALGRAPRSSSIPRSESIINFQAVKTKGKNNVLHTVASSSLPRWSRSGPVRYGCQICVPFRSTPFPSHCSRGFTASKTAPTARSDTVEAVERFIVYIRSYGAQRTVVTPSERFPSLQSSVYGFGIFRGLVFASVDYSVFFFHGSHFYCTSKL